MLRKTFARFALGLAAPMAATLAASCGLFAAAAPAQAQAQPVTNTQGAAETATPAMWRVSDEDSEVFLLGTFHIMPAGIDWRSEALEKALARADAVWFEAEVDTGAAQQKTVQVLMTEGFNPPGQKLSGMLKSDDAALFTDIVKSLGLPLAAVEPMRPWQAFLTLSVQFIVQQGYDPNAGVDSTLIKEVRTLGKPLRFFETVEQQLGFFSSLPAAAEKDLLVLTLRDWEKQTADFDSMFTAWKKGDMDAIDTMMNEEMRLKTPLVYDVLVAKRNKAWADTIAAEMDGAGTALVAVGAAHLAGADSVPALLAAKGFTVERYGEPQTPPEAPAAPSPDAANDNDPIADLLKSDQQ